LVRGVLRPRRGLASGRQGQLVEGDRHPPDHRFLDRQLVMATPQVLDEAMAGEHDRGAAILLEPTHRTQPRPETAMVGLDVIVGVLIGAMPRRREQLAQRGRGGRRLVGDDLHGRDLGGLLQAAAGGLGVALWGDEHVDDLADLVDRTVDIAPPTGDLHVGLVHEPAIPDQVAQGRAASASCGVNRCTHR
jgi:hypothetical protein